MGLDLDVVARLREQISLAQAASLDAEMMEVDMMTSKVVPIAGRKPGEATLVCIECGRYWGLDDLLPLTDEAIKETGKTPVGLCPICLGEGNANGRVYRVADIEKDIEQEQSDAA